VERVDGRGKILGKEREVMRFCSKCGFVIRDKQKNCSNCMDIERLHNGIGRVKDFVKKKKPRKKKLVAGSCSNCGTESKKIHKYHKVKLCPSCKKKFEVELNDLKERYGAKFDKGFAFRNIRKGETRKQYYDLYIRSPQWFRLRQRIMSQHDNKCIFCEDKADQVHHWRYNDVLGTEKDGYFSALCKQCHEYIHASEELNRVHSGNTMSEDEISATILDIKEMFFTSD